MQEIREIEKGVKASASLRSIARAAQLYERRVDLRTPVDYEVEYRIVGNLETGPAKIRDISESGLQLMTQRELPRGTELLLRVSIPVLTVESVWLSAHILYTYADANGHVAGCACD